MQQQALSIVNDDLNLKREIQLLSSTGIRNGLSRERISTWLKQFAKGPEYSLALFILRHLIYRTTGQIESALAQALRKMALTIAQNETDRERLHWREILQGAANLKVYFGPPAHEHTRPGKSGELITRMLKQEFKINGAQISYPDSVTTLQEHERYLLVDDGVFTGDQLEGMLQQGLSALTRNPGKVGIVVAIAHEFAISRFQKSFPDIPIFFGEKMTAEDSFSSQASTWINENRWPHEISPVDVYQSIVSAKGNFKEKQPLGFGSLGLMVAYEHGVPDDSLQLLWDESETWKPLFDR
ncbi:MAG TPA: hypothetical protein VE092_01310 [Herbaspirillum sp.]|uniref:phosphoribosyltransferase-like protein n=1 Tax=Herbaspirillum sp. TaxID=1890675 RepID=UPI002D459A30|nr:hypothetical protein [Herbaspirillum sp.]HZG18624.1 hypothetical protein [Herbaspirillum sp.]